MTQRRSIAAADGVGAGIHMLDLLTGATVWRAGYTGSNADLELSTMTRAIPTRIKVIDINGDGSCRSYVRR